MFQAAHNCDYYITKYQGKPTEQLQGLLANIATGLRRIEREEEATAAETTAGGPSTTATTASLAAERARKATLRIAAAANRSSWCSSCEVASFLRTGAHCRKTHLPVHVFLSRPLYLFEECRRLLQQTHKQLIAPPIFSDDSFRPVDVLGFDVTSQTRHGSAVQPASSLALPHLHPTLAAASADEPPGVPSDDPVEDGAANVDDIASSDDQEDPFQDDRSDHSQLADAAGTDGAHAAPPTDHNDVKVEPLSDEEPAEETIKVTALTQTTSAHDDWLHRGPFLFDLDFYTYVEYVHREPRAMRTQTTDMERQQEIFLFDTHYALANSYVQALDTQGQCKVVVLEALKCPPPAANNGEDNAVFKSLLATLLSCTGRDHCTNPLLCRPGFSRSAFLRTRLHHRFSVVGCNGKRVAQRLKHLRIRPKPRRNQRNEYPF